MSDVVVVPDSGATTPPAPSGGAGESSPATVVPLEVVDSLVDTAREAERASGEAREAGYDAREAERKADEALAAIADVRREVSELRAALVPAVTEAVEDALEDVADGVADDVAGSATAPTTVEVPSDVSADIQVDAPRTSAPRGVLGRFMFGGS